MIEKLKALLQWFIQLERTEHRHWCNHCPEHTCQYEYRAWECRGIFCANIERRDCPACRTLHHGREARA